MSEAVLSLKASDLKFLLAGGKAFVNAQELIEDLTAEEATRDIEGSPHTIARVIGHLDYWQDWFYAGATEAIRPYPKHNDDSFPAIAASDWDTLRKRFLDQLEAIKALCDDEALLNRPFTSSTTDDRAASLNTVGMNLLYMVALHNGHHFGQIISLRQVMGLWPPKAGGVTW